MVWSGFSRNRCWDKVEGARHALRGRGGGSVGKGGGTGLGKKWNPRRKPHKALAKAGAARDSVVSAPPPTRPCPMSGGNTQAFLPSDQDAGCLCSLTGSQGFSAVAPRG